MYLLKFKLVNSRLLTTFRIQTACRCCCSSAVELVKMQETEKKKNSFYGPSFVQLKVIGNGALGAPSSVLLIVGLDKYLINCGESTQKLGTEYRMGLEKVRNIFITNPKWENVSGLLGVTLSAEKSNTGLVIHGHQHIETMFSSLGNFLKFKNNIIKVRHCLHSHRFKLSGVSVQYVCLESSANLDHAKNNLKKCSSDEFSSGGEKSELKSHVSKKTEMNENLHQKHKKRRSQSENPTDVPHEKKQKLHNYVISYIFETGKIRGSLVFEKCVEFGVPPGPLLGVLKSGKNVTLENGTVVRSEDVRLPDEPGAIIIAVECPSVDYLDALLQEPLFKPYQSDEKPATVVIHFTNSLVMENERYQEWLNRFPKETKHLIINNSNKRISSVGIQRQQYKLNYLQPSIFPLLDETDIPCYPRVENCEAEKGHEILPETLKEPVFVYTDHTYYKCNENSFITGETYLNLVLKPRTKHDYIKSLVLKKNEFLKEMFKDYMEEVINQDKRKLRELDESLANHGSEYPKLVFLGTGSSKPSKNRNASCILVHLNEDKCLMFDCGESTYFQLINFYGEQRTQEVLRKLQAIYVSHLHVDHHMGLVTLLLNRKRALEAVKESHPEAKFEPVFLWAPVQIKKWLTNFSEHFSEITDLYELMPNASLAQKSVDCEHSSKLLESCKQALDLKIIATTPVCHCHASFGVSITHKDGWKITYSGDTRPCEDLVKLGMNSDILIHEATLEDAFEREAHVKQHSTTSQALEVGRKMNAKFILLTHFSQRYSVIPAIDEQFKAVNIGVAFDFMEVPYNKLPLLPALIEPLKNIFSEYYEKLQSRKYHFFSHSRDRSSTKKTLDQQVNTSNEISKQSLEN